MINSITRVYKATGTHINELDVSIYYRKGGFNYMTGRDEQRGYVFQIVPFEVNGIWRRFTAFSGFKTCILPCQRQSKKRFDEAASMMDDLVATYLDEWAKQNDVEIQGEYETSYSEV